MGLRFRRSIKILPGIRLNLSRSGVSTSVGIRGARITVGHGKVRETVGLPGTGLSYTESQSLKTHQEAPGAARLEPVEPLPESTVWRGWPWLIVLCVCLLIYLVRH
jgi:hypothetical protein